MKISHFHQDVVDETTKRTPLNPKELAPGQTRRKNKGIRNGWRDHKRIEAEVRHGEAIEAAERYRQEVAEKARKARESAGITSPA